MKHLLWSVILLTSCGYHLGTPSLSKSYETFHVSYAKGDNKGIFTSILIEKIASGTQLRYANCDADLEIKVCLSSPAQRNIGYIYGTGNKSKVTFANEGRLTQNATLTVVDTNRKCTIIPTTNLVAWFDYDFESDAGTVNRHAFSLGQLEMNPIAKDVATPPLYGLLAEKVVDYLKNSW